MFKKLESQTVQFMENLPDRPILIVTPVFLLGFSLIGWSKPAWDKHPIAVGALVAFHLFLFAFWNWLWRIDRKNPRHDITGYWAKFGTISIFVTLFLVGVTMIAVNVPNNPPVPFTNTILIVIGLGMVYIFGRWTVDTVQSPPWIN